MIIGAFVGCTLPPESKRIKSLFVKKFMASRKLRMEEEVGSGSTLSKWNRKKSEWFAYNGPQKCNRSHN